MVSKNKLESIGGSVNSSEGTILVDNDFKKENACTEEEREAIRQKAISDGKIVDPIIVWRDTLVYGFEEFQIAKEMGLEFDTKELEFESKANALAWIGEKKSAMPTLNQFQKIETGIRFYPVWSGKDAAKYGKDSPLRKAAKARFGRDDKSAIIAIKSCSSHNTVNKVQKILASQNQEIIENCRSGACSISAAYDLVMAATPAAITEENSEATGEEVLQGESKKAERKQKYKEKEITALAKYSVQGFSASKEKLDIHGLKLFLLRWNEEHPDSVIDNQEVQQAIENWGKDPQ